MQDDSSHGEDAASRPESRPETGGEGRPGQARTRRATERRRARLRSISALWLCAIAALAASPALGQRSIDGTGNHPEDRGAAGEPLMRMMPSDYGDAVETPSGADRPSARAVSNAVSSQSESLPNATGLSDFFWVWGQFVDHDIDLTPGGSPPEPFRIDVPMGDPFFDPFSTGRQKIQLNRSIYDPDTGFPGNPREQMNEITAFLDGSVVYGSDLVRAHFLRSNDGTGLLKMSAGNMPRFNSGAFLPNANDSELVDDEDLFLCGDVRANENVALTSMHTIFAREHNRIAAALAITNPELTPDEIYEETRAWVGAEIQAITYNEFLPLLLGEPLPPYQGYDPLTDPQIANEFSTAAYRFGHTMLSPNLLRLDAQGNEAPEGPLALSAAFFDPRPLIENGIDSLLRGLAVQEAQEIDVLVVDDVRNFLFGPPGAGGFDLVSLNIQRGRDHGVPGYNDTRAMLGLGAVSSFEQISSDPLVQTGLAAVYADVDEIDLWVGGLAEDPDGPSLLGETFTTIVRDQFLRLRDGDAYWHELYYEGEELAELQSLTLATVIERNSGVELQDEVFFAPEPTAGGLGLAALCALLAVRRGRSPGTR